jgi:hypothetical protein
MTPQVSSPRAGPAFKLWISGLVFTVLFTLVIWLLGPGLKRFSDTFLPDQGAAWYYWVLPSRQFWTMFIAWALYLCHQFSIWAAIYFAQRDIAGFRTRTVWGLPRFSIAAVGITLLFVILHLLQTHLWFDGLAQDVPIMTSQGSVIIMLAVILILENPRRGLFMGIKAGKPFTPAVVGFFRRSHTYIFSWALVYTFWFHPMYSDPQLLTGFFYMFLLFTQVALAWTWLHFDRRWIIFLEGFVAIHAVVVAVFNTLFFSSSVIWPMFFSGFTFMFVFIGLYALKVNKSVYWAVTGIYVAFLAWLYLPVPFGYGRSLSNLMRAEFLWIPVILLALAAVFAGLAYLGTFNSKKPIDVPQNRSSTDKRE